MKIKLIEKTNEQIEVEKEEDRYYAKMVKAEAKDICPLSVQFNNKTIDAWSLDEKTLVDIVEDAMEDFASFKLRMERGSKEQKCDTLNDCFKIISNWQTKNTCTTDFVEEYFYLRKKFSDHKSVVADLLIPIVGEKIEKGKEIATFVKGMKNDYTPVSEKHILQALHELDRQQEQRKQIDKGKSA